MSYNIDSVEVLKGKLTINRLEARIFREKHKDDLPEDNFIEDVEEFGKETLLEIDPQWRGEGSGRSHDLFLAALALTKGKADLVLTWEGGDSYTGLRIDNGKVKKNQSKNGIGRMKKIKVKDKAAKKVIPTDPIILRCSECGGRVLIGWWWRKHVASIGKISCAKCKEGGTTRLPTLG